jgi:hypothetical protein
MGYSTCALFLPGHRSARSGSRLAAAVQVVPDDGERLAGTALQLSRFR